MRTAKRATESDVYRGSGNVFADLGLPNPEEALAKARLASKISDIIDECGLTQEEAAKLMRIDQPKVSAIVRGRLESFSMERLIRFVLLLGHDVDIAVKEAAWFAAAGSGPRACGLTAITAAHQYSFSSSVRITLGGTFASKAA